MTSESLTYIIEDMKTIDKNEVGKRIKLARERFDPRLTHIKIGQYVGTTRTAVSNWERGITNVDIQHQKPLATILKVNLDWLLYGEGPMEKESVSSNEEPVATADDEYVFIPKLAATGSLGPGAINEHGDRVEKYLAFERAWITQKRWNKGALKIISASGESMSPHIEDGDIVMLDTSKCTPEDGEIFAFQIDDKTRIKRFKMKDDGRWYVICDNPDRYRFPDELAPENLRILGKKVWRGG